MKAGCIKLEHNRDSVDLLNVFPVPDGDTGTNMYLTLLSAVKEGEKNLNQPLSKVARAISMGSLMGARGNSGVILSQVFRGFARTLEGKETANALDLALALKSGAQTAYEAV
ncbi:MAG TPA: dihydroxyacetone kinase, partial [Syntrophomonas sp.]|nr:dihydroxyacetone kinase [Syntrophomonas sp.]